jgi:hypothetical protein
VVEARVALLAAFNFDISWVINLEKKTLICKIIKKYKVATVIIYLYL